ncbi:threonine dehydratase [Amycolatopsis arida]|uniref:Threonine dehydratase n=1 Tax=Amycolatopsis arida TaxID=587909 RepID=A0A1I5VBE7_9PSEU|nr:pyridoxal-phosphate dependent enzyme [Amycolatopsis arida]TDX91216.1 threonine dehydratase [Amycolatopsis arida]SFQ04732.1 threonine dehydratase [Amycolatopsis arida]
MSVRTVRVPTIADLDRAEEIVRAHLRPTPLLPGGGDDPALKLESLQPTGSFKVRGALTAVSGVPVDVPVITASAGNHALGIAFAAGVLGRKATVVVPGNASAAKVAALRRTGAELVEVGTGFDDAERHALALAAEGAAYVSAYNDPGVIAGQGTIGRELATQVDGPMTVVCTVGGGGLAAGLGLWASTRPDVRLAGAEVAASPSVSAAVRAGRRVPIEVRPTLADGAKGNIEPGSVTVDLVARHVDQLVTVEEDELRAAVRYLVRERGLVAEGAGAVGLAALLAGKVTVHGQPVVVISGRNIALPTLAEVLAG